MTQPQTERIYGDNIFFNFIEVPYSSIAESGDLVSKIKNNTIEGFITKDVFSQDEVIAITEALTILTEDELMNTPSGKIFPAPFATITDTGDTLNNYYKKINQLTALEKSQSVIQDMADRMDTFFKAVASDYSVSIPVNKIADKAVAPGTFRFFYPGMGGLHVHCGNLFQAQSMFFYSLIKNDIDMDDQLSYFLVLQQPEGGGELTIYDMLWENVKRKESPENNEFVIDDNDKKIYMKDLVSFAVKPKPGDILIFSGGPIWHRVEDITGSLPRITFGGFLNFSKDNRELYYWS